MHYEPKEARELVHSAGRKEIGVQAIAARLRSWTTQH